MERRAFITLLGGAVLGCPLAANAQRDQMRRIGILMDYGDADRRGKAFIAAFRGELLKLGWVEGKNLQIDYRWSSADVALRQTFVTEIVMRNPDLIISMNTAITTLFMQQTHTIPIVFTIVGDPIGSGFVASLARPGGNITGFTAAQPTVAGKMAEFLKEIAPSVRRIVFLFSPITQGAPNYYIDAFHGARTALHTEVLPNPILNQSDIEAAVSAEMTSNGGIVVMPDAFMVSHRGEIISSAARYRVPVVYPYRFFAENGGLMSYGIDQADNYRRAATYADRILKGMKPSDLPVQAPSKYELVINLKAAKALGVDVPPTLLARADELIE
jgi:ABC-type uncharacterized transport system substrate-binding protein